MRAVIAPERALAIQKLAATFKSDTARPLKVFQRMLGLMAAASPVLQLGLLRMRPLQRWLKPRVPHNAWHHGRLHIRVNQACVTALTPWKNPRWMEKGVAMGLVHTRKVVTTDASNTGWGALCKGKPTFGHWSKAEFFLPDLIGRHWACNAPLEYEPIRLEASPRHGRGLAVCPLQRFVRRLAGPLRPHLLGFITWTYRPYRPESSLLR